MGTTIEFIAYSKQRKTDYWKSNDRKFCDFCKCWITDNKASVSFHENGKRHKIAIANRISEISRKTAIEEKEKAKFDHAFRKMEEAANKRYAVDISTGSDITAKVIQAATSSSIEHNFAKGKQSGGQVDPMRLPGNDDDDDFKQTKTAQKTTNEQIDTNSLWIEGKSDDGHTYYWNVKTYKSVWEPPKEGFMRLKEYEKINNIAKEQQELQYALEAKNFRENVDEEVAKYNRENLNKKYRKVESAEIKKEIEEKRKRYATEEEASTSTIGNWEVVQEKKPEIVDLQLPKVTQKWIPPAVSNVVHFEEPKEKKFKEKTITSLEPSFTTGISISFNKRKPKGTARQRINDD